MTTVTPDAPKPPLTTPPDVLVEGLKEALPFLRELAAYAPEDDEDKANTASSTDFMRNLFPHLDDLTLAAFCSYVAVNLYSLFVNLYSLFKDGSGGPESLITAVAFAHKALGLAWSLDTPEKP